MSESPVNITALESPLATALPRQSSQSVFDSERLFQGQREVWIEHEGERYRLRITRRGKLILQK